MYLFKRNGRYYFRIRIPKELVSLFKRLEIKKTLKTRHLTNAKALAKLYAFQAEKLFTLARSGIMSDNQLKALIEDFFHRTLRGLEETRLMGVGVPTRPTCVRAEDLDGPDPIDIELFDLKDNAKKLKDDIAYSSFEPYEDKIDSLLAERGIKLDKSSVEYKRLCRDYIRVWVRIFEIETERAQGNYDNEYDRVFNTALPTATASVPTTPVPAHEGKKLSEVIDLYVRDNTDWKPETRNNYEYAFEMFKDLVGDVYVKSLTREHFLKFRDLLLILPANVNKKPKYRDKSLSEKIEMLKAEPDTPMSETNRDKLLNRIASLMNRCAAQGYVDKSFARRLSKMKKEEREDEEKSPYEVEDLHKLFTQSPVYRETEKFTAAQQWVPIISLYSGMRLREICQLYLDDFVILDGIPCFDINKKTKDKSLKTPSAKRTVPIHPKLIELGLLGYVERLRAAGEKRLWPELEFNAKRKGYSQAFGAWFQRINRAYITEDPKKSFHSFRHSFEGNLKQHLVDQRVLDEIMGHKHNNIGLDRYGGRYEVKLKLNAMKKLKYDIDISGLKAWLRRE